MNRSLHQTVRVRCPITHAFEIFTSRIDIWWPAGHRKYENSTLHLDAEIDGRFLERSNQGAEFEMGKVLACNPPHTIQFTWNPGKRTGPTSVSVSFLQEGELTTVKIVHSEAESALAELWPDRVALFARGWDTVLSAFVEHCEAAPPNRTDG